MPRADGDPDLELLLAETQVLWGTDSRGRYTEPPLCAVAISAAGHHLLIRPDLDDDLAESLRHVLRSWVLALPAAELRPALMSAVPLLEVAGIRGEVHGGPSYLIESLPAGPVSAAVAGSTGPGGPWAMLLDHGEVLGICYTSRDSVAGAEAGIWIAPQLTGAGQVVVAVARWAALMRERDDRPLFYRPPDTGEAAQRLAASPGLRPIGWIWSLRAG
jgi:hypothetical protein